MDSRLKLVIAAILALWVQLFWALIPIWRFGEYYSYGWLVAPISLAFAVRRWQVAKEAGKLDFARLGSTTLSLGWMIPIIAAMILLLPIRLIGVVDPTWRPPILFHALLVTTLTHWLLWRNFGFRASGWFVPVTIFALTAVPYPYQIESGFVKQLTSSVITLTHEVFLLQGSPVELRGDQLILGREVCKVTDGCSGIRSFQSLVMAGLFFGELLWLNLPKRILLLLISGLCAVVVNAMRAWLLADLQFTKGLDFAEAAHDRIGQVAFIVSALVLYGSAYLMQLGASGDRRKVIRRTVGMERASATDARP